jgi:hypothetical protein
LRSLSRQSQEPYKWYKGKPIKSFASKTPSADVSGWRQKESRPVQIRTEDHHDLKGTYVLRSLSRRREIHAQDRREDQTQLDCYASSANRPVRGRQQPIQKPVGRRYNGGGRRRHREATMDRASPRWKWSAPSSMGTRTSPGSRCTPRTKDGESYYHIPQIWHIKTASCPKQSTKRIGGSQHNHRRSE